MVLPLALPLLAAAAALVAAREHRMRAMACAGGIAAALSPAGLAVLPVLLGTAVAHRTARTTIALFAAAMLMTIATAGHAPVLAEISLWQFLPELHGLLLALAIGGAAWLAAICAARRPKAPELTDAALVASLAGPLLLPIGAETLVLALGLVIAGARLRLPSRGANDNPLPLRTTA
jgi:hypothetical protein